MSRTAPHIAVVLLWAASPAMAAVLSVISGYDIGVILSAIATLVMPSVGALIAWHRTDNVIGWLYLVLGLMWTTTAGSGSLNISSSPTDAETWLFWFLSWGWIVALLG